MMALSGDGERFLNGVHDAGIKIVPPYADLFSVRI
jgi:hypothetical protein